MTRDGFIFYNSYSLAARGMSPKDRLAFYDALIGYAIEGQEPTRLPKIADIAFVLCRPQIDANNLKYTSGCKGGRPKKTDGSEIEKPMVSETKTDGSASEKPKYNVKEKEKDNVKENVYVKEKGSEAAFEEKEIYIKFFFRNFINPTKEVRRYYAWGDSGGWVKQSGRPITDKISYAGFWKPEQEGKRFDPVALSILRLAYDRARSEKAYEAADAVFCIGKDTIVGDKVCLYGGTEADKAVPYLMAAANDFGLTLEFKPLAV